MSNKNKQTQLNRIEQKLDKLLSANKPNLQEFDRLLAALNSLHKKSDHDFIRLLESADKFLDYRGRLKTEIVKLYLRGL